MERVTLSSINQYVSATVNPADTPEDLFELYSVPSYENQYPEIVKGKEIGSAKAVVQEGDVLICKINPKINRVWVVKHNTEYPLLASSEWIVVRNSAINSNYLKWYFMSPFFRKLLTSQVAGIGGSLTRAQPKQVAKYPVPIVELEKQGKIVNLLEKVNFVISARQQQLAKLDELVKARFVEVFGNPLDGTAKYPIHQVGKVAEAVDPQPSHRTPPIEEDGIPYISIKDCDYKTGVIDFQGARRVSTKVLEEHLQRYTLHDGDFVIGKIGTIGQPIFVPSRKDYALSANIVLIQPDSELVSPYFLKYSFESDFVERQFAEAKNSTSQAAFGIQKVRTIEVMDPDLDVQRTFERFTKQIDKLKLSIRKSLEQMEILKKALMQKYFG